MINPFLIGDGIYLRPLELNEAEQHLPWLNDQEVGKGICTHKPHNLAKQTKWMEECAEYDDILLGIAKKTDDKLIGNTRLTNVNPVARRAAFGLLIGDKTEWRKGYGTEATKLMVKYGFKTLNLNKIWLWVHADNVNAIKVYKKVGFVIEGRSRQHIFHDGKYIDGIYMGILAEEFS